MESKPLPTVLPTGEGQARFGKHKVRCYRHTAVLGFLGMNVNYFNEDHGVSQSCAARTVSADRAHVWGSCGFQFGRGPGFQGRPRSHQGGALPGTGAGRLRMIPTRELDPGEEHLR